MFSFMKYFWIPQFELQCSFYSCHTLQYSINFQLSSGSAQGCHFSGLQLCGTFHSAWLNRRSTERLGKKGAEWDPPWAVGSQETECFWWTMWGTLSNTRWIYSSTLISKFWTQDVAIKKENHWRTQMASQPERWQWCQLSAQGSRNRTLGLFISLRILMILLYWSQNSEDRTWQVRGIITGYSRFKAAHTGKAELTQPLT